MADTTTYLDRLYAAKRAELDSLRGARAAVLSDRELFDLGRRLPPPRDFGAALRRDDGPVIIAEYRRASPGTDHEPRTAPDDPRVLATRYAAAGATALSVVTEAALFGGSREDLRTVRQTVSLPLLSRELVLERWQVLEAKRTGADAVSLVVAVLPPPRLRQMIGFAAGLGLHVLCEAQDEHELERAMAAGARTVGLFPRDVATLEADLDRVAAMRREVPRGFTFVATAGVRSKNDALRLADAGVDAMIVGTHLVTSEDPGETLLGLIEALDNQR